MGDVLHPSNQPDIQKIQRRYQESLVRLAEGLVGRIAAGQRDEEMFAAAAEVFGESRSKVTDPDLRTRFVVAERRLMELRLRSL